MGNVTAAVKIMWSEGCVGMWASGGWAIRRDFALVPFLVSQTQMSWPATMLRPLLEAPSPVLTLLLSHSSTLGAPTSLISTNIVRFKTKWVVIVV